MIYFLHGTDTEKARIKGRELVASLAKKKPDASVFTLTNENWAEGAVIEEYAGSQGLFEKKYIVLVDRIGEDKKLRESLLEKTDLMADSKNIFIVVEGKLDKASVTKISKKAEKTQEFEKTEGSGSGAGSGSKQEKGFPNIFALGDALGRRDKKQLWALYREFIDDGIAPEEIHGTLFWQVKSMVIAARTKSASESGLAPFIYTKSKSYAANFTETELRQLFDDLIAVSHDSRRGMHELETALEVLLLKI
jgi:DNA polymerase III delta subunit